jgi:hypothetical protein
MRLHPILLLFSVLLALPCLGKPDNDNFRAGPAVTMELKNARWFDGQNFKRGTLYVKDGRFTSQKIKRAQRRMDLKGQFLIPPLAEANNNNLQNSWGFARFAGSYLNDGVFYAAMQCGEPTAVAAVRTLAGQPATPDVLFTTACITSSDGLPLAQLMEPSDDPTAVKPKLEDFADKAVLIIDQAEQIAQKWPLLASRKTDLVKLMLSRVESPELRADPRQQGRLGLKPELPALIVRRAHQDKLRVISHVETAADFALSVQAGVDWIAHLPGYFFHEGSSAEQYRISPEVAAEAGKRKIGVITATAATALFRMPPERLAAVRKLQVENLRLLLNAGVPLLLGSDDFTSNSLAELRSLDALGVFERAALLRIASVDTPRALFPKRRLGCFDNGCEASFLLLADNPLQNLDALTGIQLRVKQGRVLSR